ncbi:VOC family protein [Georgenia halophila]|uniref:VOC family protein n=1 Tax=Georgenia halophila TaxID=620889 RepID=A0ABP8LH07_9MICO
MAQLRDIVVDCHHPAALARFWTEVLEGYRIAPYDDEEVARLAAMGVTDVEDDPTVLLERVDGGRPCLWFQRVPEPKTVKNRVHLDLAADDADAELARLLSLGAQVQADRGELVVLGDPEGNEFCLLR